MKEFHKSDSYNNDDLDQLLIFYLDLNYSSIGQVQPINKGLVNVRQTFMVFLRVKSCYTAYVKNHFSH